MSNKMHGIDVSKHQGAIDWKKVKESGVEFAIIRAGYGRTDVDEQFLNNVKGCIENNIPFGIYWFIYAINEAESIQNAEFCHKTIGPYKDKISMKVACDLEYDTDANAQKRGVVLTKDMRTNMVIAFCERMKQYGYEVRNYANPDYLKTKFNDLSQYPLWLAKYSSSMGDYDCEMWQYTSKGNVPGITGNVDMNYYYGNMPEQETEYYQTPEFTLIDSLNKIGADSSYKNRKLIAAANGIEDYKGTAEQNLKMLSLLNDGKLLK